MSIATHARHVNRRTVIASPLSHHAIRNGIWLALETKPRDESDATNTHMRSHLVVLDTAFAQPPKRIELDGTFAFDALSSNGASLYLLETLPQDSMSTSTPGLGYKVRLYDLTTGVLQLGVVVDKTAIAETMSGTRQSSVVSADGQWVYSLYLNQAKGPFIHMLNLDGRFAICVFLLTTGKEDFEKQLLWSLAQTTDGRSLYAVNGALGIVAEMDPAQLSVRRSATIPTTSTSRPALIARRRVAADTRVQNASSAAVRPSRRTVGRSSSSRSRGCSPSTPPT